MSLKLCMVFLELFLSFIDYISLFRQKTCKILLENNNTFCLRLLDSIQDLKDAFALRYQVWADLGYIPKEMQSKDNLLEVDNCDRYAIPIGSFTSNGRLSGVIRVVTQKEQSRWAGKIESLLNDIDDNVLINNYHKPYSTPFAIFESFEGMIPTWKELSLNYIPFGELSRVIVRKEFQGIGLSSPLIDFALAIALNEGIKFVFLACVEKQTTLYARHGFEIIEEVKSEVFSRVNQPARVMKYDFRSSQDNLIQLDDIINNFKKNQKVYFCNNPKSFPC